MFKTGKPPFDDKRLLAPIAILEAIWKSLDSDRPVTVNRL
jgi:hypothetical protein